MSWSAGLPAWCRSKTRRRADPRRARGFTLLEILVALVVLALAGGALIQSFAFGLRGVDTANEHQAALAHARSQLARLGNDLPLGAGELSGPLEDGFAWRASIQPYRLPTGPQPGQRHLAAYLVEVTVFRDEASPVALQTLRLAAEPAGGASP